MPRFLGQVPPTAADARAMAASLRAAVSGGMTDPRLASVVEGARRVGVPVPASPPPASPPPGRAVAAEAAARETEALFGRAMAATGLSEQQLKTVLGAVAVQAARRAQVQAKFSPQARRLAWGNEAARASVAEILRILASGAGTSIASATAAPPAPAVSGFGGYY